MSSEDELRSELRELVGQLTREANDVDESEDSPISHTHYADGVAAGIRYARDELQDVIGETEGSEIPRLDREPTPDELADAIAGLAHYKRAVAEDGVTVKMKDGRLHFNDQPAPWPEGDDE